MSSREVLDCEPAPRLFNQAGKGLLVGFGSLGAGVHRHIDSEQFRAGRQPGGEPSQQVATRYIV